MFSGLISLTKHTKKNQDNYMNHIEIEFKLTKTKMSTSTSLTKLMN